MTSASLTTTHGHRGNADAVAQLLSSPTGPDGADVAAPSWDGGSGPR